MPGAVGSRSRWLPAAGAGLARATVGIDHGVDDRASPFKQGHPVDRTAPDHLGLWTGHEQGPELRLDDAAGVEPAEPDDPRLGQVDRREADVAASDGDFGDASLTSARTEA